MYLDDFKVVQDYAAEFAKALFESIVHLNYIAPSGQMQKEDLAWQYLYPTINPPYNACFINFKVMSYELNETTAISRIGYAPGYIYYQGDIYNYEGGTLEFTVPNNEFFVEFKTEQQDVRTLGNGLTAPCKERKYAVLTVAEPSGGTYLSSKRLTSLVEVLRMQINIRNQQRQ